MSGVMDNWPASVKKEVVCEAVNTMVDVVVA